MRRCRRPIAHAKRARSPPPTTSADHFGEAPAIAMFCFNPKFMAITDAKLDRVSVVGGGSVYTAVQNLMLACRAEGLGCVLTTLLCEHEEKVREILAIPQPWGTAAAIPMGYPIAKGHGPIRRQSPSQARVCESMGNTARMSALDRGGAAARAVHCRARGRDRTRAPRSARRLEADGSRRLLSDVRAGSVRRPRGIAGRRIARIRDARARRCIVRLGGIHRRHQRFRAGATSSGCGSRDLQRSRTLCCAAYSRRQATR